jgi:membrane protease YdiL (CAAX protease family)
MDLNFFYLRITMMNASQDGYWRENREVSEQSQGTFCDIMLAWTLQSPSHAYIVAVTIVTSVWVYALRARGFSFLALAMFIPGLFALVATIANDDLGSFISRACFGQPVVAISGHSYEVHSVAALGFAVMLPVTCVAACGCLSILCGLATPVRLHRSASSTPVHAHNLNLMSGFARAAGEELGWRCWLLPQLLAHHSPMFALLLSGIAWGTLIFTFMACMFSPFGARSG